MQDKVIVITGATSGIGQIAAGRLAAQGARIVLIARDPARADRTLARLRAAGRQAEHRAYLADLSSLAEVRQVAAAIAAEEPRIDVLINNAGNIFARRGETVEGLERTFALNHMAYFVLTRELKARLLASAPARIVNTASRAHRGNSLDFDDLQMRKDYRALIAYGRSKLANILFTRELARRLAGTGVTANCLHPGFVATGLGQRGAGFFGIMVRASMLFAGKAEDGAKTVVHLAAAPELATTTGGYFADCRPVTPSLDAQDDAAAKRLWEESERLAGL
ncbi:MAG TPA: SDR family oxidoreductase [Xanthobacteraceae bacterium]|jgi:NAD(P)-dependent dehydrogenase (short-subunit alcohol dehydrogenase family)|nr:SDR family oxidoreductase [Xanthobacteraceae bacterium]